MPLSVDPWRLCGKAADIGRSKLKRDSAASGSDLRVRSMSSSVVVLRDLGKEERASGPGVQGGSSSYLHTEKHNINRYFTWIQN